jgi:hypothetical protein
MLNSNDEAAITTIPCCQMVLHIRGAGRIAEIALKWTISGVLGNLNPY